MLPPPLVSERIQHRIPGDSVSPLASRHPPLARILRSGPLVRRTDMIRFAIASLLLFGAVAAQEDVAPPIPASKMPIREITVFKDGHSLLLHEGEMPVDAAGNVVVEGLPQPGIGPFWPYSANPKAAL